MISIDIYNAWKLKVCIIKKPESASRQGDGRLKGCMPNCGRVPPEYRVCRTYAHECILDLWKFRILGTAFSSRTYGGLPWTALLRRLQGHKGLLPYIRRACFLITGNQRFRIPPATMRMPWKSETWSHNSPGQAMPRLSERSISLMVMVTNKRKTALQEKQDSKQHTIISIKLSIIVWSTAGKYGKFIHVITLLGGLYPFCCSDYKDITKSCGRVIFYCKIFNSQI